MKEDVAEHHRLEKELRHLRQLRDRSDSGFTPEKEDAVLDQMEAIWKRLSLQEREALERERANLE